jgi:hypothetical protein
MTSLYWHRAVGNEDISREYFKLFIRTNKLEWLRNVGKQSYCHNRATSAVEHHLFNSDLFEENNHWKTQLRPFF